MKLDPRQVRSKEKLQEAYLALLIEGYDQLSIQQLCKKAEITRPTFYKSYKYIQDLREDLIAKLLNELEHALTIQNTKPLEQMPVEERYINLTLLFEHIQKNQKAYETLLIYKADALLSNGIQRILRDYVKNGLHLSATRPYLIDVDENLINSYVVGAYLECIRWWIKTNYATEPGQMAKTLIEISLNGPFIKRVP